MYYVVIDFKFEQSLGDSKSESKYNIVAITIISMKAYYTKKQYSFAKHMSFHQMS